MSRKPKTVKTFKEFHRLVPELIRELGRNQALLARAASNPCLAARELGYELSPAVCREIETRLCFSKKERRKLRSLERKLSEAAGRSFDPDSSVEIEQVLFRELKLRKPKKLRSLDKIDAGGRSAVVLSGKRGEWTDPLAGLEDRHPIMKPLLEYRALCATRPRFAPPAVYEQLRSGERRLPISKIELRMPETHAHDEEGDDA